MKQLLFLLMSVVIIHSARAQAPVAPNPFPRTINVSGSAEMEVIPDEIYVQIDLREYDRKSSPKVSIDEIKSAFLANVRQIGIPDSAVSIASYEGYSGYQWWRRKKKAELFASISYQIKLNSSKKIDELVNLLDDDATQNFQVVRTSHSKMTEFRKQLKIQAMKAAKDKGLYLTDAIGEKLGEAITITEPADVSTYYSTSRGYIEKDKYMNTRMDAAPGSGDGIDFKKIKLKFEVSVLFSLK